MRDLEAIRTLQREKELAERKARQLEEQFRSSERQSRVGAISARQELVIEDDSDDEENNGAFEVDYGDESLPPPQYDDDESTPTQPVRTMMLRIGLSSGVRLQESNSLFHRLACDRTHRPSPTAIS